MSNPPTFPEAFARGLVTDVGKGIHTFSNGSEWDYWASGNCFECWFFHPEVSGELCAFESASFGHEVSPALARLFGWTESEKYPGSFIAPDQCRFFKQRPERGDDGEDVPPPPPLDPNQLVLIADPTEDIALPSLPVEVPQPMEVS